MKNAVSHSVVLGPVYCVSVCPVMQGRRAQQRKLTIERDIIPFHRQYFNGALQGKTGKSKMLDVPD
jgi:hypothetical protein